jgi:hypothetical protein
MHSWRSAMFVPVPSPIISVDVLEDFKLRLKFEDTVFGVFDMRPLIEEGKALSVLSNPESFKKIRIGDNGHYIYWKKMFVEQDIIILADYLYTNIWLRIL